MNTIKQFHTFCFHRYVWSIGGNLDEAGQEMFDTFMREKFNDNQDVRQPASGDMFGYYVDLESKRFEPWEKIIPAFKYDPEVRLEKNDDGQGESG